MPNREVKFSVIIPAHNSARTLPRVLEGLKRQTIPPHEVIVVDDGSSDETSKVASSHAHVIRLERNKGPATARNIGIRMAKGNIVAFLDGDCEPEPNWVENILKAFENDQVDVIQGKINLPKSTFLGDSISALGFPGGGAIGVEKIWHVDSEGYTDHITSANFAARREVFERYGFFDESFPLPASEDPEIAWRLSRQGVKIKYCPDVAVSHPPRTNFFDFVRWQIVRGRGNYYFKKKVGPVGRFIQLRIWSSWNIIKTYWRDPKFPLILFLLLLSFFLQQYGYLLEMIRDREEKNVKNL